MQLDDEDEKKFLQILNSSQQMQQRLIISLGTTLALAFQWEKSIIDSYSIKKLINENVENEKITDQSAELAE